MRLLPALIILLASFPGHGAAARESVAAQAARVQVLLQGIQDQPQFKKELALSLRPTITKTQAQLVRELDVGPRPGRLPPKDPLVFMIEGKRFILPQSEGQRSCDAIHADWEALDRVYREVNDLALELEEVYQHPVFCAPCADTVLTTLKQAGTELEDISSRLNADGDRQVVMVWGPETFVQDREILLVTLNWDRLIYYNIDGDSQAGDATHALSAPPGLDIRSPLLQNGIQFRTEATAERACSPGFEIRFDALAKGMLPAPRRLPARDWDRERLRSVPVKLTLLSP